MSEYQALNQPSASGYGGGSFSHGGGQGGGGGGAAADDYAVSTPQFQDLPDFKYDLNGANPNTDLQYNSFLRGYGLDSSSAKAQAAYQRSTLNAQLQAALPQFDTARKEGVTDVGESYANRGGFRSSARLLSEDKTIRNVNNQEAALRAGIADKQAQNAFGLQNQLNSLDQQRAEQEQQARMRLTDEQNQQIAYQRALAQYGMN